MTDSIIVMEQLGYTYQEGTLAKAALVDINLKIERGSCAAIIGTTGSGKSTLVQHLNRLLRPTSGKLYVDGVDCNGSEIDVRALRQKVGMLFQFPEAQLFGQTIADDVGFGPGRMHLRRSEIRARVMAALEIVGLPYQEYGQRSPFSLSGGQMRRVALAGVLAMSPSILVLDEPTTGLDADSRAEFYFYLRRVQREQGVTIVLVSHDMSEVAALADQLFVLHQGQLVLQGRPREIFACGAESLREWGLGVPPLSELLSLLRAEGLTIPPEVFTLDEVFSILKQKVRLPKPCLD